MLDKEILKLVVDKAYKTAKDMVDEVYSSKSYAGAHSAVDDVFAKVYDFINGDTSEPVQERDIPYDSMIRDIATHREVTHNLHQASAWRLTTENKNDYASVRAEWERLPDKFKHNGTPYYIPPNEYNEAVDRMDREFGRNPWDNIF